MMVLEDGSPIYMPSIHKQSNAKSSTSNPQSESVGLARIQKPIQLAISIAIYSMVSCIFSCLHIKWIVDNFGHKFLLG